MNTPVVTALITAILVLKKQEEELLRQEELLQQRVRHFAPFALANYARIMLDQQNFLLHSTFFFDIPSLFEAMPFLITGTRTVVRVETPSGSFSDQHYWQIGHSRLVDDDNPRTSFRAMYRMNRTRFEKLVNDLSDDPAFISTAHNHTPPYIQISCAVWRLANCHIGYRTANIAFGVSHGSYINFFRRFLDALHNVYGGIITWPKDVGRIIEIHNRFEWPEGGVPGVGIRRLPRVIGALDGKNVKIEAPREHAEHWRDRKNDFSMKLTAVCDHQCKFTYIRVGDSGRTHDASAYQWSAIAQKYVLEPAAHFPLGGYIIADSAYPLSQYIVVPYPSSEVTGNSEDARVKRKFNKVLMVDLLDKIKLKELF